MGRVTWKDRAVFSVETRKGLFTLAQMARSPFVFFFDCFQEENHWDAHTLVEREPLFCVSVTKQFLKQSQIEKQKQVLARSDLAIPDRWIHPSATRVRRTIAAGTALEREAFLPAGAALVLKDVMKHEGGPYRHPSGVFDDVLVPDLSAVGAEHSQGHEMTSLGVFPALNERLYLCHVMKRRVAPWADLVLDRTFSTDAYAVYLDIVFPNRSASPSEKDALKALFV